MPSFLGNNYAPPGVYTRTTYDVPTQAAISSLKIPVLIGTGNEILYQQNLEVVRGSSSSVDQRIVQEDVDGRAVVTITQTGQVVLGNFDGTLNRVQVRNFPIVSGDGTGTVTNRRSSVSATLNGSPVVVIGVDGARGIVTLSEEPNLGDVVRVTYYFKRTDTYITDNLSDQITETSAIFRGEIGLGAGETYDIVTAVNDTLVLTIDRESELTITLPDGSYTATQIATLINGQAVGTLVAATFVDNNGDTAISLTADEYIRIGTGTANSTFGLPSNTASSRNTVFYVFQRPIVDGSNGGLTTTDPADVIITVDGVNVIASYVDGANGAVTLPYAPAAGTEVLVSYYFNTWQDTFDYLAHIGVSEVLRCGITPDKADYTEEVDFILKDDKIYWGSASTVSDGTASNLSTAQFGSSQISTMLIDNRAFFEECTTVVDGTVTPPVDSKKAFRLSHVPTTGDGRNSPIGSTVFGQVSNGRIDLPTSRPDLVLVYWGFTLEDAIERGPVTVTKVDPSTATVYLRDPVEAGARVWATYYYNTLTDETYTFTVAVPGSAGVGTYRVVDSFGNNVHNVRMGNKSAGLVGITIEFPSGSELLPDARIETYPNALATGPVEETVSVTFATTQDTVAIHTVEGPAPYYPIKNASDHAKFAVDSAAVPGAGDLDVSMPTGVDCGFFASYVGREVEYSDLSGGATYDINALNNEISFTVDGVLVSSTIQATGTVTIGAIINGNSVTIGGQALTAAAAPGVNEFDSAAVDKALAVTNAINDPLNSFTAICTATRIDSANVKITAVPVGTLGTAVTFVSTANFTLYPTTGFLACEDPVGTLDSYVEGINAAATATGAEPKYTAVTKFTSPVTIAAGDFDTLSLHYNGNVTGLSGNKVITLTPGTYNTVSNLVTELNNQLTNVFPVQATGTVTVGAIVDGNSITIGGQALTAADPVVAIDQFLTSALDKAQAIVDAINDPLNSFAAICTATYIDPTSLTITAVPLGALGNAVTFVSTANFTLSPLTGFLAGGGGAEVTVTANSSGQLVFALSKKPTDAAGYLEFITGVATADFAILAGIDTAAATGGLQTKIYNGPIARRFTIAGSPLKNDRLVMRSRIVPGQGSIARFHNDSQSSLVFQGASGAVETGILTGDVAYGAHQAVVQPATIFGHVGLVGGQDAGTHQPIVTFYDGTGTEAANNVFKLNVDNVPVTVVFTGSAGGTATELGPITDAATVLGQIDAALVLAGFTTQTVARVEGAGVRLISQKTDQFSYLEIGNGSANSVLGFTDSASAVRSPVQAEVLASAMMSHHAAALADYMLQFSTPTATYFAAEALAGVITDSVGSKYLWVQSQTKGSGSSVVWSTPASDSILRQGTGLLVTSGEGAVGESGISGFYVTSSDPADGSGTANDSVFNSGTGQDGVVGQTYRDLVTGLTFTILERQGGFAYPVGQSFAFLVSKTFTTNSNIPSKAIPGTEVLVTNTSFMTAGDTATVSTFERGGIEPAVGDVFYVTYSYTKQDFSAQIYTRLDTIEAAFGDRSPDYPVSLASYLTILNGAAAVAIKQVQKDDGVETANINKYVAALDELIAPLPGGIRPDIIVPLTGATTDFLNLLKIHCDVQSSLRYKQERTAICGFSPSVIPSRVGAFAQGVSNDRIRLVYPESVFLSLTDAFNVTVQHLVEGFYIAAALSGSVVSPNVDVATPWTRRTLFGFDELARKLNEVEANQVAVNGITVLMDANPNLTIRDGLTTDMSNVLTKEPTIRLVADEIQQRSRRVLDRYIGAKYLPGIIGDIEKDLASMFKGLVADQIVAGYTGISVSTDPSDVNTARVEAYWQPVFALLYIYLTFNVRSSLA